MLWALQSCYPHWDARHWCFGLTRKGFPSIIFLIIKVYPSNESNMDSYENLHSFCDGALQSCSSHWDAWYWHFGFGKKAFLSAMFLIIKVYSWNESNLDSHSNLHSFCYCALQLCTPHWNKWHWCFGFATKTFFLPISL